MIVDIGNKLCESIENKEIFEEVVKNEDVEINVYNNDNDNENIEYGQIFEEEDDIENENVKNEDNNSRPDIPSVTTHSGEDDRHHYEIVSF